MTYAILFLIAVVTTIVLVPPVKKLAVFLDAIDYPSGRRVNKKAIPRLGGLAMFGGMCAAFLVMMLGLEFNWWETPFGPHPRMDVDYTWTACGVFVMFLVGLCDDIYDLHPKAKFVGQVVASVIIVSSGVVFDGIHNPIGPGYIMFGGWSYPITALYIVAFANIINLIDGLDGLASGITIISMTTILAFAVLTSRSESLLFTVIMIGVCLGFLYYNKYPASIFMGDSGSLLLGTMIAITSLSAITRSAIFASMIVPILAAGVPIIDTLAAIIRRRRQHVPIDQADKNHIHHKLLENHTHQTSVYMIWAWTALLAVGGVVITFLPGWGRIVILGALTIISAVIIWKLDLLSPALIHKHDPRVSRRHLKDGTFNDNDIQKSRNDYHE